MKADPSTERARSVVLLVVLTVALPSLLLTALATAAVSNEEAAARRRLEQAYGPIIWDLAQKFGSQLDALLSMSEDPLEELAMRVQERCDEEDDKCDHERDRRMMEIDFSKLKLDIQRALK